MIPRRLGLAGRQNQPLFVQSYGKPDATAEEDLKWHFVAHTSLDVFEERGEWLMSEHCTDLIEGPELSVTSLLYHLVEAANVRQNDHYAGLLQVMDDYAV
ncbi:hypothetical protein L7F22_017564 [Adiantum nelumboides]|nr:hypothetical protein [Adiantum nelumboides]